MQLLGQRYPEYASFPMPKPEDIRVFRVESEGHLGARLLEGIRPHRSCNGLARQIKSPSYPPFNSLTAATTASGASRGRK